MKQFPEQSSLPVSDISGETIRGGSIGLNRILNTLVEASMTDKRPRFSAVLFNAFTIFRNVWTMEDFPTIQTIESNFVKDLNLFLDYFDTYLSHTWNHQLNSKKMCPVVVYFPDYDRVPPEIRRDLSNKNKVMYDMFKIFLNRHRHETGLVRTLDHCQCVFITAGPATYPHRDVMNKFRDVTHRKESLYTSGDPVAITTHIPLDLHLSYRLRNLHLLESNTGRIRPASDFRFKLDGEGRVPFQSAVHVVVGDDKLIKPLVAPKIRRLVLQTAGEQKWTTLSEGEVINRLSKLTAIPPAQLRRYDFT